MTEQEELLMLRALAEKQKAELAAKDKTIEGQKVQIEDQKAQIEKQKIQIENMVQALLHARKRLFGPSSEITRPAEGQMNLFESTMEAGKRTVQGTEKDNRSRLYPSSKTAGCPCRNVGRTSQRYRRVHYQPRGDLLYLQQ